MKLSEFKLQLGNIGFEDDDNDNDDDDDDEEGGGCRQHAVLRENSSKV